MSYFGNPPQPQLRIEGYHVTTGVPVAIKIINKDKLVKKADMDQKVRREIYNLKRFRHPHIIKLYEVIETQTDIFLVMELVGGGELFDYLIQRGKLPEVEGRLFFQQMISAVGYCHYHKVAHRDLKPENLLLSSTNSALKIADFGLSNLIQDGEFLQTSCGSPNYAAPEVIDGKYYSGEEIDVWSSGVILYALLTARLPFDDDYIPHLFIKIKRGKYKMPSFLSGPCQDLIKQMLNVDPLKRITIPEIKNHPWFKQDLPVYLRDFPEDNTDPHEMFENANLDEQILGELQQMYNMSRSALITELHKEVEIASRSLHQSANSNFATEELSKESKLNPLMISYWLLYDQAQNDLSPAVATSRNNFQGRYSASQRDSVAQSLAELSTSPPMNLREEIPFLDSGAELNVLHAMNAGRTLTSELAIDSVLAPSLELDAANAGVFSTKRPWYLGVLSRKAPNSIMKEVYRSLKKLSFEWKVISPYQIQARAIQPKNLSSSQSSLPALASASAGTDLLRRSAGGHGAASPGPKGTSSGSTSHSPLMAHRGSPRAPRTSHLEVPQPDSPVTVRRSGPSGYSSEGDASLTSSSTIMRTSSIITEGGEIYVKLMIQLFKVNPRKDSQSIVHLLDIKKMQGQPLAFFDLCSTLMKEIQI